MDTVELKKYALKRAMEMNLPADKLIEQAEVIYKYLAAAESVATDGHSAAPTPVRRPWKPKPLTKMQKVVLTLALKWRLDGEKINGTQIAMGLKMTQSAARIHLRALVAAGYIARDGNKFTPVRGLDGQELAPILTDGIPAGYAKGYVPLTTPIAKLARVKM